MGKETATWKGAYESYFILKQSTKMVMNKRKRVDDGGRVPQFNRI